MKVFEKLGRFGLLRRRAGLGTFTVGSSSEPYDAARSDAWRDHARADLLRAAWGPPAASNWSPYHKPTLFAALEETKDHAYPVAPRGPTPSLAPPAPPPWAGPGRAVVLDLPGELSVAYGAYLVRRAGYQPVVTFNNWPHPRGLLDMVRVLGALLYYVPWVAGQPSRQRPDAPPVFLLDSHRFGYRRPRPRDFDNRYYLMDSDLPSGSVWKRNGIHTVVYVRPPAGTVLQGPGAATPGPPDPMDAFLHKVAGAIEGPEAQRMAQRTVEEDEDDLNPYLHDLPRLVELEIARVEPAAWSWTPAQRFRPAIRKTVFTTVKDPVFRGFRRNAAGGFGALVPEPGSGG